MVKKPGSGTAQAPNKAKKNAKAGRETPGRLRQIGIYAGFVRKSNPKALPIVAASGVGVIVLFVLIGLLTGLGAFLIPLGVLIALVTAMFLFGRFGQSAQFAAMAGQPGAAAHIVQQLSSSPRGRLGNWKVTPTIAGNRNLDVVHRVVGRPGVVLLGEGSPAGLSSLIAAEKRKIARIAYGVPIHEIQVGGENGQIPLKKLQSRLIHLPNALKSGAAKELQRRLETLPTSVPTPKGPVPRAGRMPWPPRPRTR
jgi:hypothetical protein